MKSYKIILLLLTFAVMSCEIDEIPDPNSPDLNIIVDDASVGELQNLLTGMEAALRREIEFYYDVTSIIGRDYWYFTGSDPRYTGELLGKNEAELDNAGFYSTRPYAGRYKTVKNGNIILDALNNTSAPLTAAEKDGYRGWVKTIQAYELLLVLNMQYENGIRLDVADSDNLGPFVGYDAALSGIRSLLDEAATHLDAAGSSFIFSLSGGFAGFDTPASFRTFNRGLAARVAIYQNDKSGARSALAQSFMDAGASFDMGPSRYYSSAGGELLNPVFRAPNQADGIIAHPDFVAAIDPADDRSSKVALRNSPLTLDGLTGSYDVVIFPSNTTPVPYMTNEELILIQAEANIGFNNGETVNALNTIRTGHGLDAYAGGTDDASLVDEMLAQRRMSLFGQGHRWVDMRRYNRLGELTIDRVGDDVWVQLLRPDSEE